MTLIQYTIDDFSKHLFDGFDYTLSSSTLQIIDSLTKQLNISETHDQASNVTIKRNQKNIDRVGQKIDQQTWNRSKPFKTTHIEKKEGLEKTINDIRYCLNNISNTNYQLQSTKIVDFMKDIPTTSYEQVAEYIQNNASMNKMNSALYADLSLFLLQTFPEFTNHLLRIPTDYLEGIKNVKCVSSSEDFDLFCEANKANDLRKGLVHYIVHLFKRGIIECETVKMIIHSLIVVINTWMDIPDKMNEVDEVTENLFLFTTMTKDKAIEWSSLYDALQQMAKYKAKEHVSLSSRAIFKFMDMIGC